MDNKIHMTVSPSMVKALAMLKNKGANQYDLAVLVSLIETKGQVRIGEITEAMGVNYSTVIKSVNFLLQWEMIENVSQGCYSVVDQKQEQEKVAVLAEIRAARELVKEAQEKLAKLKTS